MSLKLPNAKEWSTLCLNDGEFMLAARHWNGGVSISIDDRVLSFGLDAGQPMAETGHLSGVIEFSGNEEVWRKVLAAKPERFNNDVMANVMQGQGLSRNCDPVVGAQYFHAFARAIELLRPSFGLESEPMDHDLRADGVFDAPGRQVCSRHAWRYISTEFILKKPGRVFLYFCNIRPGVTVVSGATCLKCLR